MLHLIVGLCAMLSPPPDVAQVEAGSAEMISRMEATNLPVRLPRVLTRALFERYCSILELSEAQQQYAETFFERHLTQCGSVAQAEVPSIREALIASQHVPPDDPTRMSQYTTMMAARDRYDDGLAAADDALFRAIESFLAESQLPAMTRVRLHRARDRSPSFENRIHESTIDLAALVEQRQLDETVMAEVDPVLWQYEQEVTPLFIARDKAFRESLPAMGTCFSRMFVGPDGRVLRADDAADMMTRSAMLERVQQISSEFAAWQERIVEVNRKHLALILAKLPPHEATCIRGLYQSVAWSYVYPDVTDPEPLYQMLLDAEGIDDELRFIMEQRWNEYRARYEELCTRARSLNERNEKQLASTRLGSGIYETNQEILELMWQRIALNNRIVTALKGLLPPEVVHEHKRRFLEYELAFERERPPRAPLDAVRPAHIKRRSN